MAALVCDLCGGKLVMGSGGIATCDSCGMEHSQDRMKEKVQEIKGVVQVDNSHMVDNWMKMGLAAAQAGNNQEAYEYFTKVIEVDPKNWRAIFEKGKAGAWQSNLMNLRTAEIYQGITMAMEIINGLNMPDEEVVGLKNEFAVALFNINNAITDLMDQNLFDLDDKYFDAHWDQMWNTRQRYITNADQLEDALSLIADLDDDLSKSNVLEFKKRMCSDLRSACASIQFWNDYSQSSLGYLGYEPKEKEKILNRYWKLVDEIREVEPNFATDEWSYPDPFGPGLHTSKDIYNYWKRIEDEKRVRKEREQAQKRFNDYWKEHSAEKEQYETRIAQIDAEIKELQDKLFPATNYLSALEMERKGSVPAEKELSTLKTQIADLSSQKNSLGLFQGKQKKALQEQIEALQAKVSNVEQTVRQQRLELTRTVDDKIASVKAEMKPSSDKISELEKEKGQIQNELKKPR
ncbi:MAG: hypothetical protein E7531_01095 [Ruminococcaceae bacterium]|nr:hypothetical protein [Oscillospiraceae bacterium]